VTGRGPQRDGGPVFTGSPLAPPPDSYQDPRDHSQFHTIIRRITGEESYEGPKPPLPPGPRPPSPKVHVGGGPAPPAPPSFPAPGFAPPPPPVNVPAPPGFSSPFVSAPAMGVPAAGVSPFIEQPAEPAAPAAATPEAARHGRLVALFGCKGGVGNTFVAINLAAALARTANVCLVDMDLQMGDILTSLNLEGRCAVSHLIREVRTGGETFNPRTVLDRHEGSGVYVLSQVHCLEELDLLKPSELVNLFGFLKTRFPYTIIDGLRGFDDNSMVLLDAADIILLVVSQDVPSVRAASRSMEIFRRIGYDPDKVRIVVNRYYKKALVTPSYIGMSLKTPHVDLVRRDFPLALKSLNEGIPLHLMAPQSKIALDIDKLADALRDRDGRAAAAEQPGGLLQKLRFWK